MIQNKRPWCCGAAYVEAGLWTGKVTNSTLLRSIGKLKQTIGMITYRYSCALDSKGKTAFKNFYL